MNEGPKVESSSKSAERQIATQLARRLNDDQRRLVIRWLKQLQVIASSEQPTLRKAKEALRVTQQQRVVLTVLTDAGMGLRRLAWRDRSWAARLGMLGVAGAVATQGATGAGIAAMGGAIGVPLWLVIGAGGTFAGTLIDELVAELEREGSGQAEESEILEAEYWIEEAQPASPLELLPGASETESPSLKQIDDLPAAPDEVEEGLLEVLRRAYGRARRRRRDATDPKSDPVDKEGDVPDRTGE